jgi:hypothetical protein
MRVTAETITVLPDPERRELVLVMAGHRIVLAQDEARALVDSLSNALDGADSEGGRRYQAKEPLDREAIAARVAEQVISWAQIAEAVAPKK